MTWCPPLSEASFKGRGLSYYSKAMRNDECWAQSLSFLVPFGQLATGLLAQLTIMVATMQLQQCFLHCVVFLYKVSFSKFTNQPHFFHHSKQ